MTEISISDTPLDGAACTAMVTDDACGGVVVFSGTARNNTGGRMVFRLEYECYRSMALKELRKIAEAAIASRGARHVVIHHRTGVLDIGEVAVVVAVSAPHRGEAFSACQYIIDILKETVPIWKKEVFEDGEQWVSAHP